MGTGITGWTGNGVFHCSDDDDTILLRHDQFSDGGAFGSCSNGSIVARGVSVEDKKYTSQLNVTVTPDIAGKTLECYNVADEWNTSARDTLSFVIPTTGLSQP